MKNRDEITGFVTLLDTSFRYRERHYDNVFSFTTPISSDLNNDLGELKALILARGDRKATYKDIVGLTSDEYNRSTARFYRNRNVCHVTGTGAVRSVSHGMITAINIHFVRIQHLENLREIQHPLPEQMRMVIPLRSHQE